MVVIQTTPEFESKFWSRVDTEGDCLTWQGYRNSLGYGATTVPGVGTRGAHRVAYLIVVGEIPDGLVLDHLCRNPPCVNPQHLEPVTSKENTLRGILIPRQTMCRRGLHEYSGDNIRESRYKGHIRRSCKLCQAEARRKRFAGTKKKLVDTFEGKDIFQCRWGYHIRDVARKHFTSIESARNFIKEPS
jgi:hypothetical protein